MKKGLVTILLISGLMMTMKSFLGPSNLKQPSNIIRIHFFENDSANEKPNYSKNFTPRVVRDNFSHINKAGQHSQRISTVSGCGYNVSIFHFF